MYVFKNVSIKKSLKANFRARVLSLNLLAMLWAPILCLVEYM